MADITTSQVVELADPKLRQVALRVVNELRLAAEKAVAHHAEPANYPVTSNSGTLEQLFLSRFQTLSSATQQAAVAKVMPAVKAPMATRMNVYGDLAKVNLQSAVQVETQVKALEFPPALKFPLSHLKSHTSLHGAVQVPGGMVPQQTTDKLELRIHRVKCIDETNGFLGSEAGDDEIALGGSTVDESGETKKVSQFTVRSDFDDGEERVYSPPRRFTWFNLHEGTEWPKSYFVTLVLAEVDMGGLADFLNRLVEMVRERVIAALAAAVGGMIGASGGPVGAAIGAAVGFIVGKVFEWLRSWWSDDIFKPFTDSVNIPSLNARWPGGKTNSPQEIAIFSGHGGKYQVTYDWRIFA